MLEARLFSNLDTQNMTSGAVSPILKGPKVLGYPRSSFLARIFPARTFSRARIFPSKGLRFKIPSSGTIRVRILPKRGLLFDTFFFTEISIFSLVDPLSFNVPSILSVSLSRIEGNQNILSINSLQLNNISLDCYSILLTQYTMLTRQNP